MTATVLVTGFEGYGGRSVNPALELVNRLDGAVIGGATVQGLRLAVEYRTLGPAIRAAIDETTPLAVIGLGLWPGEAMLRLERVALNQADFEIADNRGLLVAREPVVFGGPAAHVATLPLHTIQDRLLAAGIPCRLSGSAGQFLCNALMYHALAACAARSPSPACGFVHLPYLPQQVAAIVAELRQEARLELHQRADLASMGLDTLEAGIRLAIEATLEGLPGG
jgi:pyroglutamyl-peptidase